MPAMIFSYHRTTAFIFYPFRTSVTYAVQGNFSGRKSHESPSVLEVQMLEIQKAHQFPSSQTALSKMYPLQVLHKFQPSNSLYVHCQSPSGSFEELPDDANHICYPTLDSDKNSAKRSTVNKQLYDVTNIMRRYFRAAGT